MDLVNFEIQVLHEMLRKRFNPVEIDDLCSSMVERYEYSGNGYFLTIRNVLLPKEREVISKPIIIGQSNLNAELLLGFIIFVEQGELTIECHSYRAVNLPNSIRNHNVDISTHV